MGFVEWENLGKVIIAGILGGIGTTGIFCLFIIGLANTLRFRGEQKKGAMFVSLALALIAGLVCVAVVLGGLLIMTNKG